MITKEDVLSTLKEEQDGMTYEMLCSALGVETIGDDNDLKMALIHLIIEGQAMILEYMPAHSAEKFEVFFGSRSVKCESCGYEVLRSELDSCDDTGEEVCPFCVVQCEECGARIHPEALHISEDGDELCSICIQHADSWGDGELE